MAKIVHFGKYYYPDQGGIESVTLSLAKGSSAAGHAVKVICFANNTFLRREVLDGVNVLRSRVFGVMASQPISFQYLLDCMRSAWKADIVHVHMPNLLAAFCAIFAPRRVRLLVHWHSDVINKSFLGRLASPLQFLLLCKADAIVATSPTYLNASVFLSHFRSKTTVIPIGIDAKPISPDHIKLPEKLEAFIKNKKIILAVGRLVPYKGFEFLIHAARSLAPEIGIIIVGDGPMRPKLESCIKDSNLDGGIMLAGRLDDVHLNKLFHVSTIYCMPSVNRAEAFGVVMLEAMSCGLPIVATNISGSGVPWVNKHGSSGINVPIQDSQSLVEAFNQILSSESLRSQLSKGAKQRFDDEFTAEISISRMHDLYIKLLQ